jgi:hypothetical protein
MVVCYVDEWHVFCMGKYQPHVAAIDKAHCAVANFKNDEKLSLCW